MTSAEYDVPVLQQWLDNATSARVPREVNDRLQEDRLAPLARQSAKGMGFGLVESFPFKAACRYKGLQYWSTISEFALRAICLAETKQFGRQRSPCFFMSNLTPCEHDVVSFALYRVSVVNQMSNRRIRT